MLDKLKLKSKSGHAPKLALVATPGKRPSTRQIFLLRTNFGVNLGSCFVMEKWIFHGLFGKDAGCELEAAKHLILKHGEAKAKEKLEAFWSSFMSNDDWKWLKDHGITAVRVPLGYWDINGGRFTKGTAFEPVKAVYANAWTIFKQQFVEKARSHDIGVLFDLHGLPFGANQADHSGETSGGGVAGFWLNSAAQLQICEALAFVARDLRQYDNIVGIQVVNEAEFCNDVKERARFYTAAATAIRGEDDSAMIVISDGWWPNQWVQWHQEVNPDFVIDTHCYRCFSDVDKKKSPKQIINDLENDFLTNLSSNSKGVDFLVGEYSCVLDGESWKRDNANNSRDELVKAFGRKQQEVFRKRAGCGSYFWTFKFQSGNGGEWDLRTMVNKGVIVTPKKLSVLSSDKRREKLEANYKAHVAYWAANGNGAKFEHDRYRKGFETAWNDSTKFAEFNGSQIGRVEAWKSARLLEHIKDKGNLEYIWEWTQGFEKGLEEYIKSA